MLNEVVEAITHERYVKLFLLGDESALKSIWRDGNNRAYLERIVQDKQFEDIARVVASEILYKEKPDYPPSEYDDALAYVYSQALRMTGNNDVLVSKLMGNQWGFLYHDDELGDAGREILGRHLMATGNKSIPYLIPLLDDTNLILYEGSQEATLGNSFGYRVKDAAAYYIAKLLGIDIRFYQQIEDRDKEIKKLKSKLREVGYE
ncbi:hypothetical protein SAMN05216326_13227 [Nitrosomonas marina]|uniref:Uncharacterized protein n=1 Tax=Nitrosomonas marina TaxID=917 RepID=A0A1I0F286_9PROT|nr:hypothetical protein [Nitrosomonas marina]SET51934.1 hypothetical protein SAMN05216326_13227 [Nitrosomonas marina]